MIEDVTTNIRAHYSHEMHNALTTLVASGLFGRETLSTAIGEISEILVAGAVGASRVARNNRGHDLILEGSKIEVKSRFISRWGDSLQFNFGAHTADAHVVYCLAWHGDSGEELGVQHAFRLTVPFLIERWRPKTSQRGYCARTDLGALKRVLAERSHLSAVLKIESPS